MAFVRTVAILMSISVARDSFYFTVVIWIVLDFKSVTRLAQNTLPTENTRSTQ